MAANRDRGSRDRRIDPACIRHRRILGKRKAANEEREVLIGLRDDFEDLRVRLSQWAAYNEAGVRLLDLFLSDSLAIVDRSRADSALVLGTVTNVLDQGGPLEALFASGRLELIRES